jgi:hypothetical protein
MAIYHLNVGFVSRSTGRSCVQSAAYITGETLHESRRDLKINYQNRSSDVAFFATLAPDYLGDEFRSLKIWDTFETFEDTYAKKRFHISEIAKDKYINSAQTAMTIVVAIPKELPLDTAHELVVHFTKERFVSRGLIATYAIHEDEGNPHAHIQISRRSVDKNGDLSWAKDREIATKKELLFTRKLWADLTNQYLEREGMEARITEKSFKDLNIDLTPTHHRGWYADKLTRMGEPSRVALENVAIFNDNQERLRQNPAIILNELTANNATFRQIDVLKAVTKRMGDNPKSIEAVFEGALARAIPVGLGMDGQVRYTSADYKAMEDRAVALLRGLLPEVVPQKSDADTPDDMTHQVLQQYDYLSNEQKTAVMGLTQHKNLSVLVGRAGAALFHQILAKV